MVANGKWMVVLGGVFLLASYVSANVMLTPIYTDGDSALTWPTSQTNHGNEDGFVVSNGYDPNARAYSDGVLNFPLTDLSGYNAPQIVSATLYVYSYWTQAGNGMYVNACRLNKPWSESTVTYDSYYNTSPAGTFTAVATSTWLAASTTPGWVAWNVTGLVQDWVGGTYPNDGIGLTQNPTGPSWWARSFWNSRESSGNHPYLEVTVVPEPTVLGLLGMGLLSVLGRRRG